MLSFFFISVNVIGPSEETGISFQKRTMVTLISPPFNKYLNLLSYYERHDVSRLSFALLSRLPFIKIPFCLHFRSMSLPFLIWSFNLGRTPLIYPRQKLIQGKNSTVKKRQYHVRKTGRFLFRPNVESHLFPFSCYDLHQFSSWNE